MKLEEVIHRLNTVTQYLISAQIFAPAVRSPASAVSVVGDDGVPSRPRNLTAMGVTNSTISLKWLEPEKLPDAILGYNLYYMEMGENHTEKKKLLDIKPIMDYSLTSLKPYTKYEMWLKAFTETNEGPASNHRVIMTDVQEPSAPHLVDLSCQSTDSIYVQWSRPTVVYHRIDFYFVSYRSENTRNFDEIEMPLFHEKVSHALLISNLTENSLYEVKVRGASRSVIEHSILYKGEFSEPRKILLQSYSAAPLRDTTVSAGMVAGAVCVSFALMLAIISIILWRKYFQAAYYYLDDLPCKRVTPEMSETFDEVQCPSVPVNLWSKHVADLHADTDIGFSKEYEEIQHAADLGLSSGCSQLTDNKNKNRYVNIVAYDHSRVILNTIPGEKRAADYINANYIDGYNKPNAYIGTQGPLPGTFEDFWRLVWEQNVFIIVMITNLVERGRRKCDMYWSKEGTEETFGIIQVKLTQEVELATYTIRTFTVKNLKVKKKTAERTVRQYHYTNWPDHGVPEHPLPVLNFVTKSAAANPVDGGPIIVHCSAGVGRTGTYIVLDAMLKQIAQKQSLSVCSFLKRIRRQRNFLVQTEEQYIFIHDALQEAIDGGDTEVPLSELSCYIQNIQSTDGTSETGDTCSVLEKQFKLLTSFKPKDYSIVSALKSCNKPKNRNQDLIPLESYRVHITPKPGKEGSDYINASFLQGFNKLHEFIITQHPTTDTLADFWQMVWDHNSQTVVILSQDDEEDFPRFWPLEEEEHDYETFKVKLSEECGQGCFVTRDFILQSTTDDYEVICRVIQCSGWPEMCSPLSTVYDLVYLVQEWHLEYQNGPMVVVDRFGGTEAATFCCLSTVMKQLEFENCVDVYMYCKLYHMRRPGVWQTQDDYLFLYKALESRLTADVTSVTVVETDCVSLATEETNSHANSNGQAVKMDSPTKETEENVA